MIKRLLIAAGLLAIVHVVVLALRWERWPSEVAPPQWDLAQLPYQLKTDDGTWEGEKKELDAKTFLSLRSDQVEDRAYSNRAREAILLHSSSYTLLERWVPHPPDVCYGNAGWKLESRRDRVLQLNDGRSTSVRLYTFSKEGVRILVLFWYHFGDEVVLDHDSLRAARWKRIGQRTWPAITKFMLQTDLAGGAPKEEHLCRFAQAVLNWTLDLQSGRSDSAVARAY